MTDSMIERVAKAIAEAHNASTSGFRWDEARSFYEGMARAAIEAMRETTPEIEACFDKYVDEAPHWAELIDAALSEKP